MHRGFVLVACFVSWMATTAVVETAELGSKLGENSIFFATEILLVNGMILFLLAWIVDARTSR